MHDNTSKGLTISSKCTQEHIPKWWFALTTNRVDPLLWSKIHMDQVNVEAKAAKDPRRTRSNVGTWASLRNKEGMLPHTWIKEHWWERWRSNALSLYLKASTSNGSQETLFSRCVWRQRWRHTHLPDARTQLALWGISMVRQRAKDQDIDTALTKVLVTEIRKNPEGARDSRLPR